MFTLENHAKLIRNVLNLQTGKEIREFSLFVKGSTRFPENN